MTNLHNPTCAQIEERWLKELAGIVKGTGTRVLIDEVYLQCMYNKAVSGIHHGTEFVTTGSLTKAYGLGGLRCGWILAEPSLARRMWQLKDLIDPSAPHPAELLSVMAFRKLELLAARAMRLIDNNRVLLRNFVRSSPQLEVQMPEYGTCVFPRLQRGNADRLSAVAHDDFDTDVVPGRFFEMPDHFRLGIGGDSAILAEGLDRLRRVLERSRDDIE
jgi:aspartate/methionine/tyrosine aminotransferase